MLKDVQELNSKDYLLLPTYDYLFSWVQATE